MLENRNPPEGENARVANVFGDIKPRQRETVDFTKMKESMTPSTQNSGSPTVIPGPNGAQIVATAGDLNPTASIHSSMETPISPGPSNSPGSTAVAGGSVPHASKGLATGAIAGIAAGIGLLAILLGVVVFFVIRRKKSRSRKESYGGDPSEHGMMVVNGKQVDVDDGSGSGVPHSPGAQPLQHEQAYQLVTDVGPSSGSHYQSGTPVIATPPPPRASVDRDLIDRPVSPPLPEDAENRGHGDENPHVTSRDLGIAGSSGDGRASAAVDREEDPEMQWILEEERRAKERKEQQEELRRLR